MVDSLFTRTLLPVASKEDARKTAAAALPRVKAEGGTAIVVHVIEKADGAPDKAGVEQRRMHAEDILNEGTRLFDKAGIDNEDHVVFGTDVVETILDGADQMNATSIAYCPRDSGRLTKLLTGDVARHLVQRTDRPLVMLPANDQTDGEDRG